MSMISELVERLRRYARFSKTNTPSWSEAMTQAADTIEELSAKLSALKTERSDDWIPCEEQMPEEHESRVAKLWYGTINWSPTMHRKESYNVIVTAEFADGTRRTEIMYTRDGKWFFINTRFSKFKVIAWQPFPEPYWEKQNET